MTSILPPDGRNQDPPTSIHAQNSSRGCDLRQQLYNDGEVGHITDVQMSTERIVQLNGIMYDLDPQLICESSLTPVVPQEPHGFYDTVAKPWLSHHPVLAKADVRISGTGLHAILWFADPPTFDTDGERDRWTGIVQAVQAALPIDTDQPHITAVTRPIGSINSKNSAEVKPLVAGQPVTQAEVMLLFRDMQQAPFTTVMQILTGSDKIKPCPICGIPGKQLSALKRIGNCYGSCGKVTLSQLYDVVLSPRPSSASGEVNHD